EARAGRVVDIIDLAARATEQPAAPEDVPGLQRALGIIDAELGDLDEREHREGFVRGAVAILTKLRDEIRGLLRDTLDEPAGDVAGREADPRARAELDGCAVRDRARRCGVRLLFDGRGYRLETEESMTLHGLLEHYIAPLELGLVAADGVRVPGPPDML